MAKSTEYQGKDQGKDVEVSVGGKGDYYVYALSRRPVVEGFDLRNIFYVCKGTGTRWKAHFKETLADLRRKQDDPDVVLSRKKEAISELYETGGDELDIERHAYLVEWGLSEAEALRTEALVIKMMKTYGNELTNMVSGHHEAEVLMPAGEVRRFYAAEKEHVERLNSAELADFAPGGPRAEDCVCVVVKGSNDDKSFREDELVEGLGETGFQTAYVGEKGETPRRGWDPRWPWSDEEARERARHYWTAKPENAVVLKEIADEGRLQLALAIKDPRAKETVIRYIWEVDDTEEPWLWYPYGDNDAGKVGFPLGRSYDESEDPWLGKALVQGEKDWSIFVNRQSGICYVSFED
ncbi:MAG: GIY-YIG nuclease family protein [Corynebacterium sp.]|nr:GIY-YIG nuclease family protein [Corynebacterium sp.]